MDKNGKTSPDLPGFYREHVPKENAAECFCAYRERVCRDLPTKLQEVIELHNSVVRKFNEDGVFIQEESARISEETECLLSLGKQESCIARKRLLFYPAIIVSL